MDNLGDRMKRYEHVTKTILVNRMPVIIRLDGVHFHTFTRGFVKPFDMVLVKTMQETMEYLCRNIQNCVLGYTQSDEITLVLCDYKTLKTSPWFDNEVQKICSVVSSIASMIFNKLFAANIEESNVDYFQKQKYKHALQTGAFFDARVFNVPVDDVTNCVLWRQNDATRNSIQSVGQANFSQKQLHCKSCNEIQDMLFTEKGINWNDLPTTLKRGSCCVKDNDGKWIIDNEIPIFRGEDRNYIENRIKFE